jgi:hypothetical protein
VTEMLVVPENVHTGSPPFLKCGLAAKAGEAVVATAKKAAMRMTSIRRIIPPIRGRILNA